ncbi:MAG TPA: LPS export ABC transporter ATP-binding protein [Bacillota bacterium]|nr:LPS export ABC transporter ATP-binding protein [Bacillota bacterium]HPU75159.1 LPS export ABC transporter ATP-binding protein [Bacillota bacterium]
MDTLKRSGICAADLVKSFAGRRVVDGASVSVELGEIVGLLGPNGAGKTTTFYMLVGLEHPDSGRISIGESDVTSAPVWERARRGLGYLAQEPSIFRRLTVEANIMSILQTSGATPATRASRLESLLDQFDLARLRRQMGFTLSGGERRRVEIARALAASPSYMLLDEPFTGVDPIAVGELQEIVVGLKQAGLGVLITDHNVRDTLSIVDRAYIMHQGRILVSGTAQEISDDSNARQVYLGDRFSL